MPLAEERINILRELGQEVRLRREGLGVTFEDVYQRTKIQPAYLDALENADYGALPGAVYTLGFIRTYLGILKFDELYPEFRHWLLKNTRNQVKDAGEIGPYDPPAPGFKLASRFWIFVVLLLIVVGAVIYVTYSWSKDGVPWGKNGILNPMAKNDQRPEKTDLPSVISADVSEDVKKNEPSVDVKIPPPEPKKELVIKATVDDCWLAVRVSNGIIADRMLKKGETFSMELTERVRVNYGRASVVTVIHNGKDLGIQRNRHNNYYDPDGKSGIFQQP